MPIRFEGFSRVLAPKGLKPGRWFMASSTFGPQLCMMTEIGGEANALVLMFGLGKVDAVDFRTNRLPNLDQPFTTVEDDVVFEAGEGLEKLRLTAAGKKPFPSGSLLRLANGDMGLGFAERLKGDLFVVSLTSGSVCEGFELAFDRWSLSLRRGDRRALVGHFRGGAWKD